MGKNIPSRQSLPLRVIREERHLSQKEVSEQIGFDFKTYRNWETNKNLPSGNAIISLCELYGVSADFILGLSEFRNIGNKEISQSTGLSDKSIEVLRFLNSFSEEPDEAAEHRKTIDFINIALEEVWEQILQYRSAPNDHAPITPIFHAMMQYLVTDNSELRFRNGEQYVAITSETAAFDIDGDVSSYTIAELGRIMIIDHIRKWLDKRKEGE